MKSWILYFSLLIYPFWLNGQTENKESKLNYSRIGDNKALYVSALFDDDSILSITREGTLKYLNSNIEKLKIGSNVINLILTNNKYVILTIDSLFVLDKSFKNSYSFTKRNNYFSDITFFDNQIVLVTEKGFIQIDTLTRKVIEIHQKNKNSKITFDKLNKKLLLGCYNGDIVLYDPQLNKEVNIIHAHKNCVSSLQYNDTILVSSDSREIKIWNKKYQLIREKKINTLSPISIFDDKKLTWFDDSLKTIMLWNIITDSLISYSTNVEKKIDQDIDTNQKDGIMNVISLNSFKCESRKKVNSISSLALSNDEKILLTANNDGNFFVINALNFDTIHQFKIKCQKNNIITKIRPDNFAFFAGTTTGIRGQYDINTGNVIKFEKASGFGAINSANYSADGNFIQYVSSTDQSSYTMLENASFKSKKIFNQYGYLSDQNFSLASLLIDNNRILIAKKNSIIDFKIDTQEIINTIQFESNVNVLSVNKDKTRLYIGDSSGCISIYCIKNLELIKIYKAHNSPIISIKAIRNSDTIISCSNNEVKISLLKDTVVTVIWEKYEFNKITALEYLNNHNKFIYTTSNINIPKLYYWKKDKLINNTDEDYKDFIDNVSQDTLLPSDYFIKFIPSKKGKSFLGITFTGKIFFFTE